MDKVIKTVCDTLGVTETEFHNRSKKAILIDARFIAMHLCVENELGTLEEIGFRCGDKDHSTVLWAIGQSKKWIEFNSAYREKYELCKSKV